MRPLLEVSVDSITSAKAAIDGGADRLEVCSSLECGGLTPSNGLLRSIRRLHSTIPLFVMIRPRVGDFCYSSEEIDHMLLEIKEITEAKLADGFVLGALKSDGTVDVDACNKLLYATQAYPVTFHRAFDLTANAVQALDAIIDLGFDRVLTSGQSKNAKCGLDVINMLIERSNKRIIVIATAGIDDKNVEFILRKVKVREVHTSASELVKSKMQITHETVTLGRSVGDDYIWKECDEKVVTTMISIMKRKLFILDEPTNNSIQHDTMIKQIVDQKRSKESNLYPQDDCIVFNGDKMPVNQLINKMNNINNDNNNNNNKNNKKNMNGKQDCDLLHLLI